MDPSSPSPQDPSPEKAVMTRPGTPSSNPAWNPAATTQASTPQPIGPQLLGMPKSPLGHPIPVSENAVVTQRKHNEESPLFRRSLRGRRPDSPTETVTGGLPETMKIPHGFENPGVKKQKGVAGLSLDKSTIDDIFPEPDRENIDILMTDEKGIMTDDGDERWVDEMTGNKRKVFLDHAVMSSPVIPLILIHKDKSGHDERVEFRVHKGLLANSVLLSASLGPDTTEIILDCTLKPYAVSAIIQYLYTADFSLDDKFQTIEDEEGYFEKLTSVEWTCCYLGVSGARELTLSRIEKLYSGFEFQMNAGGLGMRIKMTDWLYSIHEDFVTPRGKIQRLRQRVLAGWCRDLTLVHEEKALNETFENILVEHPTFSFDLREYLNDRAEEDKRMEARLAAFERAEERGQKRYDHRRNLFSPNLARHTGRFQLPTVTLADDGTPIISTPPVETPKGELPVDLEAGPPLRRRATRVSDASAGIGMAGLPTSRLVFNRTP
ncbi:hypothetical protein ABW21_db0206566 [Orbilia brochopaga]|nr:hypothetical protein ABW21_db0206566 [Drechslerella brochopaga]